MELPLSLFHFFFFLSFSFPLFSLLSVVAPALCNFLGAFSFVNFLVGE